MPGQPKNTEEAIWEIYARVVSLETTIRGTPNTKEGGLVQAVEEVKALAVETKDTNISQGQALAWLQARCRAFHGERGNAATPGNPVNPADPVGPLAAVPKKRVAGFLLSIASFVSLVIYNLGIWVGWWQPPNPP